MTLFIILTIYPIFSYGESNSQYVFVKKWSIPYHSNNISSSLEDSVNLEPNSIITSPLNITKTYYSFPTIIGMDSDNNIYISGQDNSIYIFNNEGKLIKNIFSKNFERISDGFIDKDNIIYLLTLNFFEFNNETLITPTVKKIDRNGKV